MEVQMPLKKMDKTVWVKIDADSRQWLEEKALRLGLSLSTTIRMCIYEARAVEQGRAHKRQINEST